MYASMNPTLSPGGEKKRRPLHPDATSSPLRENRRHELIAPSHRLARPLPQSFNFPIACPSPIVNKRTHTPSPDTYPQSLFPAVRSYVCVPVTVNVTPSFPPACQDRSSRLLSSVPISTCIDYMYVRTCGLRQGSPTEANSLPRGRPGS